MERLKMESKWQNLPVFFSFLFIKLKLTGLDPPSYWSRKTNYSFWCSKIKPKRQKIVCQHQVDFHFESVLEMYKTQKMIFETWESLLIILKSKQVVKNLFFYKKFDMTSRSIKIDQNENGAPTIRGVCFCPSYVRRRRRRGDRFFPGTLFQDRYRRPQAAGEPEKCTHERAFDYVYVETRNQFRPTNHFWIHVI